jgi:hypothetical protein
MPNKVSSRQNEERSALIILDTSNTASDVWADSAYRSHGLFGGGDARFSRKLAEAAWRSAFQQALAQRLSGALPGRTGAAR